MFKRIRTELMNDEDGESLSGDFEIDDTSFGGRPRVSLDRFEAAGFREAKPTILGMIERGGLRVQPPRRYSLHAYLATRTRRSFSSL